ncbi:phosphatidate cytidylyltransferase [Alicyclobacillus tolerans]|uniref:phosphatidate cytidylyltransferase n=1 Tax=Alicyclobacillus tolerans TaxID=90970 RepID=UPI003B7BC855
MIKQRVLTATIGVAVILIVLLLPNAGPWEIAVWLVTAAGVTEFVRMFGVSYRQSLMYLAVIAVTYIEFDAGWYHPISLAVMVALCLLWPVLTRNRNHLAQVAPIFVGMLYIGIGGHSMIQLRLVPHGWFFLWSFLIAVWMSDTAAFFVGRWLQGPKLWPDISPKKTISGSLGGILGAAVGAALFGLAVGQIHLIALLGLGAGISILSQLGDLIESAYKRSTGVKDSGTLLPGHGGILDRVDSLLFAAPFMFYMVHTYGMLWFSFS